MKKTKQIQIRVSEELKLDMALTANYYNLSLSKFIELMYRTSQDKDNKTNNHIENFMTAL